jgi:hypothetical protein
MIETQSNTINTEVVEKIRKLLRLATSNTPAEAELAMSKAKQFAIENDIDLAMVDAWNETEKDEPFTKSEDVISLGRRKSVTVKFVCWIVQNHFNVRVVYSGGRYGGTTLTLIGKKSDIEISTYVWNYLNQTFMECWHKYQKDKNAPCSDRASFFYGMYKGLDEKLANSRKETEDNRFAEVGRVLGADEQRRAENKYALVCTKKSEKLEEALYEFFPKLRKASSSSNWSHSENAFTSGRAVGSSLSINRAIGGQLCLNA